MRQPLKSIGKMFKSLIERMSKARVVRLGNREIVAEGLRLNFWADISHRCMTASWPAFIGGAALVFVVFNAIFAGFYWIGDQPVSNVPGGAMGRARANRDAACRAAPACRPGRRRGDR